MTDRLKTLQAKPLSTYHHKVISDFVRAVQKWGKLTEGQERYLTAIENEYSQEAVAQREKTLQRLLGDDEYRADVKAVCDYYLSTGYYRTCALNTLQFLRDGDTTNPPHLPSIKKMMENKYAQNILASIRSEPKFEVGELVQLRANVSRDNFKGSHLSAQAKAFMVVEVGSRPVTRALSYDEKRGGTRWYKLLVMGSTDTIEVIEKELKRPTKKLLGKK